MKVLINYKWQKVFTRIEVKSSAQESKWWGQASDIPLVWTFQIFLL